MVSLDKNQSSSRYSSRNVEDKIHHREAQHHMTQSGSISTKQHDRQQAANDITEPNVPEAVGIYSRRSWQCVALRYRKPLYGNVLRTAEFVSGELGTLQSYTDNSIRFQVDRR